MEHGDGVPGLDLIESKGEREAPGELLNAAERSRGAVDDTAKLRQHLVKELQQRRTKKKISENSAFEIT